VDTFAGSPQEKGGCSNAKEGISDLGYFFRVEGGERKTESTMMLKSFRTFTEIMTKVILRTTPKGEAPRSLQRSQEEHLSEREGHEGPTKGGKRLGSATKGSSIVKLESSF